jgi:hypothetical protein
MDMPSVVEAVLAVGRMMADPEAKVVSVDFNPVIVGAVGQGYAAVDALVMVTDTPA